MSETERQIEPAAEDDTITFRGIPILFQRPSAPSPIYVVRDREAARRLCGGLGFTLRED